MRSDPLARAARAFRYWERRQEAVAHNLANASTPGFKAERVFARLLADARLEVRRGTDLRPGALNPTGRTLDLALEGDGFLVVETPAGERFVRGGSFRLDASRRIVDARGNPLLADTGPVVVPEGATLRISPHGEVLADGTPLAVLRIERAPDGAGLRPEGEGRFVPPGNRAPVEEGSVRVHSGHLEESNVEPVEAMVEMIEIQRAVSALQRSVLVMDGILDRAANRLSRVE